MLPASRATFDDDPREPLGNGAYRIKEFVPGHDIVYERVKDYWGKASMP